VKQISDGAVSARIRCCGDPATDSWHTIYLTASTPQADVEAWESDCVTTVQDQHASLQAGLAYLQSRTEQ
jgi:hypothetical protein